MGIPMAYSYEWRDSNNDVRGQGCAAEPDQNIAHIRMTTFNRYLGDYGVEFTAYVDGVPQGNDYHPQAGEHVVFEAVNDEELSKLLRD